MKRRCAWRGSRPSGVGSSTMAFSGQPSARAQPYSSFTSLGVFEAQAEALGQVARKVVAANPHGGSQVDGIAVVHHQLGGLRADIHHRDAFAALLRQHRRIARGQRFEDRLLHHQVRLVHRAHQGVVLLHRGRHQVDVDFQARRQHFARIAVARMIVHHEILRKHLQDHAVFLQLHARGAVHHAVHVALLDFANVPQFHHAAAIGAAHASGPPMPTTADSTETPATASASRKRGQDRVRHGLLVGDPALDPALRDSAVAHPRKRRRRSSRAQITSALCGCPRRVQLRRSVSLPSALNPLP